MEDPYSVLGVDRSADADEIKRAYRRMALKLHPDKNPEQGTDDAFKRVLAAYDVLSDPDKRARFDATGSVDDIGSDFPFHFPGFPGFQGFPGFPGFPGVPVLDERRRG